MFFLEEDSFDKEPHQMLLLILKDHGIRVWIIDCLTDIRQRVVVDGEISNWKSVLSGTPQWSIL